MIKFHLILSILNGVTLGYRQTIQDTIKGGSFDYDDPIHLDNNVSWIEKPNLSISSKFKRGEYLCSDKPFRVKETCFKLESISLAWTNSRRVSPLTICEEEEGCKIIENEKLVQNSMVGSSDTTDLDDAYQIIKEYLPHIHKPGKDLTTKLFNVTRRLEGNYYKWESGLEWKVKGSIVRALKKHLRLNPDGKSIDIRIPVATRAGHLNGIYGLLDACSELGVQFLTLTESDSELWLPTFQSMYCKKQNTI